MIEQSEFRGQSLIAELENMSAGIDCALDCTKKVAWIKANGNDFLARYYRNAASKWTALAANEARAISAAGIAIVALWESNSAVAEHFSYTTGVDEGTTAYKQAMNTGQPARTPIYFAVDFDCSNLQIAGAINDYFRGIEHGFNAIGSDAPAYDVGVYGSGNACRWLLAHQRVSHTWLAQSTGWGGYKTFSSWNIKQGPTKSKTFDFDTNEAKPNYGGFSVT
jgi:hypothetical protein